MKMTTTEEGEIMAESLIAMEVFTSGTEGAAVLLFTTHRELRIFPPYKQQRASNKHIKAANVTQQVIM